MNVRGLVIRGQRLIEQGHYLEAQRMLRRAVARANATSPTSVATTDALNQLGVAYQHLARFSDAGPLYQRALGILERRVGHWHPQTATVYHNLGGLEHAAGNWLRGERFAREALRIRLRTRGDRHPEVAADMVALAALLDPQKKYHESEGLYRRAIDIYERTNGPRHAALAVALTNLAAVHRARGRPRQAETLYRRAIEVAHAVSDRRYLASLLNNLAALVQRRGRMAEAETLRRESLRIFRRTRRPAPPGIDESLRNRAVTATVNPRLASFRLHVGRSRVHGFGVFADQQIPAGKRIIEYAGERIARREAVRRGDAKQGSYLFALDSYWRIDGAVGGSGAEFVNHSCDPNTKAMLRRGTIQFVSKRKISRGEELTLDYKYSADLERLPCQCGARTCRGAMNRPRQGAPNA